MGGKYFTNFPIINYANVNAINIMSRVNFSETTLKTITNFYPYIMTDGERPDNLAYNYYGDSYYDWLVMMSNQIIDPYYSFPLSTDDFNAYLNTKYGSVSNSQNQIFSFITNGLDDNRTIDQGTFDSLPPEVKKYWNNQPSYNNLSYTYVRKLEPMYITTNRVVNIPYSNANGSFIVGETISQPYSSNVTSTAVIVAVSNTNITAQHYIGEFISGTITGLSSNATATISNVLDTSISSGGNIIQRNITQNEDIYWKPYYAYDYEHDLNEMKRNILLVDKTKSATITNQIKLLLANT